MLHIYEYIQIASKFSISEPKSPQHMILGFFMRAVEPALCNLVLMGSVSFLAPRFPPFLGYFFCRLAHDWFREDPCGLDDKQLYNVLDFRGNYILNIIRALGLLILFIAYGSGF
jgi:hypothetical protein